MGPIRTAIREFIDNRPERVARRREFLRDLLNPLDVIGETDRQQGVSVERRPIRRMLDNISGIGGRIERGDPLTDVMTGAPSTTAPASTVQPVQKTAPPKVNPVIGDEEPTAPLTLPPSQFQQASMPMVRSARQSDPDVLPATPESLISRLARMRTRQPLTTPAAQQDYIGATNEEKLGLTAQQLADGRAEVAGKYQLLGDELVQKGLLGNRELDLKGLQVGNEGRDIDNRFNLGLGELEIKRLLAAQAEREADDKYVLGTQQNDNNRYATDQESKFKMASVGVEEARQKLEEREKTSGAFLQNDATRKAAESVYDGGLTLPLYRNTYKRENSSAVGNQGIFASDDDAVIEVKDAGYLKAASELREYFTGDEAKVKGGLTGMTNRIKRFIREVHGEQIKLSLTGGKSAPTQGNPAGVMFPKLPPREIANMVTTEAISYMQVEPNSDEAKQVRLIVDQMVMPAPPAGPRRSNK
jgi:hypothetical protein